MSTCTTRTCHEFEAYLIGKFGFDIGCLVLRFLRIQTQDRFWNDYIEMYSVTYLTRRYYDIKHADGFEKVHPGSRSTELVEKTLENDALYLKWLEDFCYE